MYILPGISKKMKKREVIKAAAEKAALQGSYLAWWRDALRNKEKAMMGDVYSPKSSTYAQTVPAPRAAIRINTITPMMRQQKQELAYQSRLQQPVGAGGFPVKQPAPAMVAGSAPVGAGGFPVKQPAPAMVAGSAPVVKPET